MRLEALPQAVLAVEVVVIGIVRKANGGTLIEPQVYLKGAASSTSIPLVPRPETRTSSCEMAKLDEGQRVMAFLRSTGGQVELPGVNQVFWFSDGRATGPGGNLPESELVAKVRAVTNQYAVPAASQSEGAGIDWGKTVLPLSAALGVVFVIGLVLMRVWHRIDPS